MKDPKALLDCAVVMKEGEIYETESYLGEGGGTAGTA